MEEMVTFSELQKIYRGKKVFLTGHTGFKGSWMLKTLHLLGAEIKGYALSPENDEDLYNIISGDTLCDSVIADIRDIERLMSEVSSFQPDFIFHLAAQPLVRLSYDIPSETFDVNAMGSAYLLDAVRILDKKCSVVMITTDKVYHNNEWEYPYRENDRLGGYDPYSASKACAELIIDSYRNSFFNTSKITDHRKGIAVARAGNVIGGGDWSNDRLIPDIVRSLSENKPVIIRNPNSIRPWQHVIEPIVGYLQLGMNLEKQPRKFSNAFNFGPSSQDAISVKDMVQLAIQAWGSGKFLIDQNIDKPHEAGLLKLDISKANFELGWRPKMNASLSIKNTMEWYLYYSNGNIENITTNQIINYFSKNDQ
jgi:CDP-glucose 4,6-dehydratase